MEAQLFDGTILEFPDGTAPEVIQRVVKQQTAARQAAAPQEAPAESAAPAAEEPSTIGDMTKSFGSGIIRGAVELGMLPATVKRLGDQGAEYVVNKGDALVRSIFGLDPMSDEQRAAIDKAKNESWAGQMDNAIFGAQDAARGVMDDNLYAPRTTPGKYAETVGEFVAPGGIPSKAARAAPTLARKGLEYAADLTRTAVVPGVVSEAAGQVTEGTKYEPWARLLGALTGNVTTGLLRAANTPESALRRAVGDAGQIDWARALGLQNNSTGVRLTGPEAITQAQNGASALPNVLRMVEGSVDGRAKTAPFFADRPQQVDTAVTNLLDAIGPQSPNPSVLGPRASEAATTVLDDARQGINAQTKPLYKAAEPTLVPDTEFQAIAADPRFKSALARLRENPDLAPDYAGFPDNSVAVIDAVTKDMFARGEALANKANPLYGPELAGKNTEGAVNARDLARDPARGGSPEYDQALKEQARLRREQLQPLQEGPLGSVAAANDTTAAGNAILPQNPLTGSQGETADAVRRLVAQDPETTVGLVRQNVADRYAKAATETQEGNREFAGAKFHKDIAGNQQRRGTLDAVLANLPTQDAMNAAPELLDVLQATGRRKPIGSATDFNASLRGDLGVASPAGRAISLLKSLGTSFVANAGDAANRLAYRRSIDALADMFIAPNSVEIIRDALNRGAGSGLAEALARTAAQTPAATRERN
ncbi:hypothetical protein EVC08_011 [Rhizobium phage RHph_N65]|nr:hypothetical protein EVC08_011 [Rhizobium phage RHph_N65]